MRSGALAWATSLALIALTSPLALAQSTATTRAIDPLKSKATFSVQHIFVERVTGSIPITGGTVALTADSAIPVSISAELDPGKVSTDERDRDASLTGPDFFDVKNYPLWTFTSTKITPVDATHFGLDGILTIHGTPQPEHLDVTVRGDSGNPVYHAVGHIDRKAFHMGASRLDPVIGNVADITLDVTLK
jgi:polyisoprenoid-binding protein YceI